MALNKDDATVKFKKLNKENSPIIVIKLRWNGQGWLIIDDNLFGKGGIIRELNAQKRV